jgi:hypothetical protein
MSPLRRTLAAQGAYYVGAGVAPFVSRRLFEAVTGPKREWWLVQMVGLLAVVIGGALLHAASHEEPAPEAVTLATGSAVAFAGIDVVYVARGRIAPTYLLDAVAEAGLLAALARSAREEGFEPPTSASGGRRSIR